MTDIQLLNASVLALKSSVDALIAVLRPSLQDAPFAGLKGEPSAYDPELGAAADALRLELRNSGYSTEQIENIIETYLVTDAQGQLYTPQRTP